MAELRRAVPTVTRSSQIRGSTLLVSGQLLSLGLNFASQVLIVRALSTYDFGVWGHAIALVAFWKTFAPLGLDEAIARFVPIYHEEGNAPKVIGALALCLIVVFATSTLAIGALWLFPDSIAGAVNGGVPFHAIVFVVALLIPIESIDVLITNLFACFARPKAIFFRRHVLGPGLRLTVVLLLVLFKADVMFLAIGYLAASAAGVLIFATLLVFELKAHGLLTRENLLGMEMPGRELLKFSIPLMTTDIVSAVNGSVLVLVLARYSGLEAVALYRAVLPVAMLNKTVMTGFGTLYVPAASRLLARGENAAVNSLYWHTAAWLAALSFPVFAFTFSCAGPLVTLLYGERYAAAGVLLTLMSLGYYVNVATGFNGATLKVYGRVPQFTTINLAAAAIAVILALVLVPRFGALGAAISSCTAMITHNFMKQVGLRLTSGVNVIERSCMPLYGEIAAASVALLLMQVVLHPPQVVSFALAAVASTIVLLRARQTLKLAETFPEARRVPVLGWLVR